MHRLYALDGEVDQHSPGKIEQCKEVEVRCQPERIGYRCRDEPANQVARNVAGDVGRKSAARIHRAALLAEIGECQRKGGSHAEALADAKDREDGQVWRACQQRRRHRKQNQAHEDAEFAIDMRAEEADHEAGNRHAHGAGVHCEAHCGGADAVMTRQRR